MLRLLYWVIIWINFILQCLIYFVLRKALIYLRETSLILIFLINLLQHVSVHRCFNTGEWTLLSWQTKCSDFLIREKKKLKQFPSSSPSMLHSLCFGSWKVAYYSEGRSLPFCAAIIVQPAKELKIPWRLTLIPGHSLGHRYFLPYVSALAGAFSEVKGQWEVQSLLKSKQDIKHKTMILRPHHLCQDTLWEGPSRDKLDSSNIKIQWHFVALSFFLVS